jgi:two-component system, OmpR family, phosphate regulon sensor histidine kinase PhoR
MWPVLPSSPSPPQSEFISGGGKIPPPAKAGAAEMEDFQRRQQQTTIDAKAQQQVLFNSMLEGLLLLDRNRKIYLANRAFKNLFGLKIELRGKTIMEALRLHELAELVERVEAEGQVFDHELKLPELSERWLQVNAAVISNSAGEREGTILVFHDLTRLKQLERTREEFVANVSHELRTPLSLIKGYVETLLDGARNNPESPSASSKSSSATRSGWTCSSRICSRFPRWNPGG